MFIVLLISSVLGACDDHKDVDKCLADSKCVWNIPSGKSSNECFDPDCGKYPMRGLCGTSMYCEWAGGKCSIVNCLRYPVSKCPTDKSCMKFPSTGPYSGCYPKTPNPNDTDACSALYSQNWCKGLINCEWTGEECVQDGCYHLIMADPKCNTEKCKKVNLTLMGVKFEVCVKKSMDPEEPECYMNDAGAECDGSYNCMTAGDKCKKDKCMGSASSQDACEKMSDCVWGLPSILKDYAPKDQKICYHKDHVFAAGALGVLPALIQNKIFQLASALLLYLLI